MNLLHELEKVLYHPTYMGQSDKAGVNLAVNDLLNKIDELGFEIVEKPYHERVKVGDVIDWCGEHLIVREVFGDSGVVQECTKDGKTNDSCYVVNSFYWTAYGNQVKFVKHIQEDNYES